MRIREGNAVGRSVVALVVVGAVGLGTGSAASSTAPGAWSLAFADISAVSEPVATSRVVASDSASAQTAAMASGLAVEDVSQRTESQQVFALPDGSWRADVFTGPEWVVVEGDGSRESDWSRVDTTLRRDDDGWVRPVAYGEEFVLHAGGGASDVILESGLEGSDVAVRLLWNGGVLPAVELDGSRATYRGIAPGVDYVVHVFPSGFEQFYVLHTSAAAREFGDLVFEVEVVGGAVVSDDAGHLRVVDDAGNEVAAIPTPTAWDAKEDSKRSRPVLEPWSDTFNLSPGLRLGVGVLPDGVVDVIERSTEGLQLPEEVPLSVDVVDLGSSSRISLEADAGWLLDASTVYPVVIDPSLSTSFDTYVQSNFPTATYGSATELLIGTWNSGTARNRSFINFNTSSLKDVDVLSAHLYLWNHHSWSCSSRNWSVHLSEPATSSTTWNNQPTAYSDYAVTTNATKGYSSSCAAGWVTANITSMVQFWTTTATTTHGVRLTAGSETDNFFWKRFASRDWGVSGERPFLSYTFNTPPNTPTAVTLNGTQPAVDTVVELTSSTPTLGATVTDPDGGNVRAVFAVYQDGVLVADGLEGSLVASGNASTLVLPFDLSYGSVYKITVKGHDARISSSGTATPTWSFRVVGADPADIPTVCDEVVDGVDLGHVECGEVTP